MTNASLELTGISKRYNTIQTLDDVSLTLRPGEVLGCAEGVNSIACVRPQLPAPHKVDLDP